MSDESKCSLCGCILTLGDMYFAGHTEELCRAGTLGRIRMLETMLSERMKDIAMLRDMIARHVCAPERAAEEKEKEKANVRR